MSKQKFEQIFETRAAGGSASQASFLERTTIALLSCGAATSTAAVLCMLIQGVRHGTL